MILEVFGTHTLLKQQRRLTPKVVAVAGYPLIAGDRVVGVMALFARTVLTPSTLDALAAVAHAISEAFERQRLAG